MVASGKARASGTPGAVEEAQKASEEMTAPEEPSAPRETEFRTPKFHRMTFSLDRQTQLVVQRARRAVDEEVMRQYSDAFWILNQIWDIVRAPELDEHGEPVVDSRGLTVWKRKANGLYDEDFTRLTRANKEHFMGLVTTRLFTWEQQAADLWGDAMMARARFEERFAIAYDEPISGTVDDRKARGNRDAAEERYFAIFATTLSRKADSIVKSMDRIALRLRDSLS